MIPLRGWLALGLVTALVAAFAGGCFASYRKGVEHERGRTAAAQVTLLTQAVATAARIGKEMTAIGDRLAVALDESRAREGDAVRVVREVVREDPDFAAVRRPERLGRLRREQLDAINRAAGSD